MATRRAFTLIELLTVIAIIALLAAITFPVYTKVKDSGNRSADLSHMNTLRSALQLYESDQGGYPPALLGYVTLYTSGPSAGNVVPADQIKNGYLFPRRLPALTDLKPAYNRFGPTVVLNDGSAGNDVVFPNKDAEPGAIFDANGDGNITTADDVAGARQAFGPADGPVCWLETSSSPVVNVQSIVAGSACSGSGAQPRRFYAVSGYDVSEVPLPAGAKRYELRYARFWTVNALVPHAGTSGSIVGGPDDDPRQLGYSNPPDDTVVTWNSYYRDYSSAGVPSHNKLDLLLTLGGAAKPVDSKQMSDISWRQRRTR